jgi:hypothetical protein
MFFPLFLFTYSHTLVTNNYFFLIFISINSGQLSDKTMSSSEEEAAVESVVGNEKNELIRHEGAENSSPGNQDSADEISTSGSAVVGTSETPHSEGNFLSKSTAGCIYAKLFSLVEVFFQRLNQRILYCINRLKVFLPQF